MFLYSFNFFYVLEHYNFMSIHEAVFCLLLLSGRSLAGINSSVIWAINRSKI